MNMLDDLNADRAARASSVERAAQLQRTLLTNLETAVKKHVPEFADAARKSYIATTKDTLFTRGWTVGISLRSPGNGIGVHVVVRTDGTWHWLGAGAPGYLIELSNNEINNQVRQSFVDFLIKMSPEMT